MTSFVIFDLDGTLVETEQVWRDVRRTFVETHGGRWRDDAQSTMIGMRTGEWADYIHDELGVLLPQNEIAKLIVDDVVAALRNVPVLPGAEAALERAARRNRLGLATSAARPVAETVLETTGWKRFFEVVVSADDVAHGKPAPDVYLRALELMRASTAQTVAVEDSTNGIRSAHAADLRVIAIPNREFPPSSGALALAWRVIPNLDALQIP
ncbi:MAG TPA: HAD family phosphatase [Candidatus Baltobacteraceae bacterium]|nr:HAD family phosphatase [Candidatus Baltobacteraceae bacterium]